MLYASRVSPAGVTQCSACCYSLLLGLFYPSCFFFNASATTEIYTLSLHDALPIFLGSVIILGAVVAWGGKLPLSAVMALAGGLAVFQIGRAHV